MSVSRRSDTGNWLIDFTDRFGRVRKTVSREKYTKRQAEALERRLRREREEGKSQQRRSAQHRWSDLAARYWLEHGQHLSWAVTVKGHLEALSNAIGDATFVDEITPDLIAGIFGRWRGKVSESTLNRRLAVLRGAWNRAAKVWDWPLRTIAWEVLMFDEPETIERNLTAEEVARLIEAAPQHLAYAIEMAILTGLRRGAILGLTWDDIHDDRKEIITKSKGRAGGKVVVVPITPAVDQLLDRIGRQDVRGLSSPTAAGKSQTLKTHGNGPELAPACRASASTILGIHLPKSSLMRPEVCRWCKTLYTIQTRARRADMQEGIDNRSETR